MLLGSIWQFFSIIALAVTQDEVGLFTVTAIFGLGFSGRRRIIHGASPRPTGRLSRFKPWHCLDAVLAVPLLSRFGFLPFPVPKRAF